MCNEGGLMKGREFVGKVVEWTSQAQDRFKTKRGIVLEYVPANKPINYNYTKGNIALASQRSRLLVSVSGVLYTPVGCRDGSFPSIKVVEDVVDKTKVLDSVDALLFSLMNYQHSSIDTKTGSKIRLLCQDLERLKDLL